MNRFIKFKNKSLILCNYIAIYKAKGIFTSKYRKFREKFLYIEKFYDKCFIYVFSFIGICIGYKDFN